MFTSAIPPPGRPVTCPGCWPRWESASWGRCSSSASSTASGWSTAKGGTASSTRGGRFDSQRSVTVHESSPWMCCCACYLDLVSTCHFTPPSQQPREPGMSRQDQAMLLADSSEDEFWRDGTDSRTAKTARTEYDAAIRAQFAQRSASPLPPQSLQFKEPNASTSPTSINSTMVFTGPAWCTAVEKNNHDICRWEDVKIK